LERLKAQTILQTPGRDTLYTMRWNIEYFKKHKIARMQYATSIRDAYNKGSKYAEGLLSVDKPLVFKIPVYKNLK